jgi:site-specific recombinase XerD
MQSNEIALSTHDPELDALVRRALMLAESATAPRTRTAYRACWRDFESWCAAHRLVSLPCEAATLALCVSHLSGHLAISTIAQRLAAIAKAHRSAGFESPARAHLVREVLKGARRVLGVAPRSKDPLLVANIRRIVANCPASVLGIRDRALVLCGFAMGSRRSELADLNVGDLSWTESGVVITWRGSKTDQEHAGHKTAIPFGTEEDACPVRALRAWLDQAGISEGEGTVFRAVDRHGHVSEKGLYPGSIARILKRASRRAGLDDKNIAGHSLRSGMATQSAMNGASERSIAQVTQHKSMRVLRRYIRDGGSFHDNASGRLGL